MQGRAVAGVVAAALGTVVVAGGAVVLARSGEVLPGTTLAGADVSGEDRAGLTQIVRRLADDRTAGVLLVRAAEVDAPIDRSLTSVDVDSTVAQVLAAGRGGSVGALLGPLLGGALASDDEQRVELEIDVDQEGLRDRLEEVADAVDRPPAPGGFTVGGTTVTTQPPVQGLALESVVAADVVTAALRENRQDRVDLPVEPLPTTTTVEDTERVGAQARAALAGPYSFTQEASTLTIVPAQIAPLLSSALVDASLVLQVDTEGLTALVDDESDARARPARRAGFEPLSPPPLVDTQGDLTWAPQPAALEVRPAAPGLAVDVPATSAALAEMIMTGDRAPRPLPVQVTASTLSTEQAQSAGVRSLLGTFTTYFTAGQPRATNIRRIAELVDDAYLPPSEVLSLNRTAGERTRARGFLADGAIVDGELTDEVGGGVSQFATTLFNAAFFAGLPIPEHQPHSFYISRYPAGRESTVYFGQIDVKLRNDTASGISVQTSSTPGSVTVALYGDNGGRTVTSTSGPREPRPDGGFRISVTRTIAGGDGRGERRVFRTTYDAAPE